MQKWLNFYRGSLSRQQKILFFFVIIFIRYLYPFDENAYIRVIKIDEANKMINKCEELGMLFGADFYHKQILKITNYINELKRQISFDFSLRKADLFSAEFNHMNISYALLCHADLGDAYLYRCTALQALFMDASLKDTVCKKTVFDGASFNSANIVNCSFYDESVPLTVSN